MKTIIFKYNHETSFPKEVIDKAPLSGPFDEYAEYLLNTFQVELDLNESIKYLKNYGAWTLEEMQDLETNKALMLWLAILDCKENKTTYFHMGF